MNQDVWMQSDLVVFIDGNKIYTEDEIVDDEALSQSIENEGEFFIFSCCCGIPSCAGWHNGIESRQDDELVLWRNPYNGDSWRFDKASLKESLESVRQEARFLKEFFESKNIRYVGFGYSDVA